MAFTIKDWNIEAMTGYVPKTSFYRDFSIADRFGVKAIKDTYSRAFSEWKGNTVYITEFVMALNWKIWEHYEHNPKYGELYSKLWEKTAAWCENNLKGDDLSYYFRTTD